MQTTIYIVKQCVFLQKSLYMQPFLVFLSLLQLETNFYLTKQFIQYYQNKYGNSASPRTYLYNFIVNYYRTMIIL